MVEVLFQTFSSTLDRPNKIENILYKVGEFFIFCHFTYKLVEKSEKIFWVRLKLYNYYT